MCLIRCSKLSTIARLTSYGLQDKLRKAGRGGECAALHRTLTYHRDHGYGMDAYTVGPTMGAGVPALMEGKEFVYPLCYKEVGNPGHGAVALFCPYGVCPGASRSG